MSLETMGPSLRAGLSYGVLKMVSELMMLPEPERWSQIQTMIAESVEYRTAGEWDTIHRVQEANERKERELTKRFENIRTTEQWIAQQSTKVAGLLAALEKGESVERLKVLGEQIIPGFVYYLERDDGLIKIGAAKRVVARRRTLEGEHGTLSLRAVEPGYLHLERQRHIQFQDFRQGRSEWFKEGQTLHRHIGRMRAKYDSLWNLCEQGAA